MKDFDINNIWEKQDSSLEKTLKLNIENLKSINIKKVRSRIRNLIIRRLFETSIFFFLTFLLVRFTVNNSQPQFICAGVILAIFALTGSIGSVWQLVTIFRLDYAEPIKRFQVKLEKLKLYSLRTLQLLLLSIPFYMAYIIIGFKVIADFDILLNSTNTWLISNAILTIIAFPLTLHICCKLNINSGNNWIKRVIADNGGKQIDSALQFIEEIRKFDTVEPESNYKK
jgi:hypothetical protein